MIWDKYKLGDICTIKTGNLDVNQGDSEGEFLFFTCALKPLKSNTYSFNKEAILLPGNGANVGEVIYYKGKFELYQRTYVLYDFEKAYPKYIYHFLKRFWYNYLINKQYGSATNYIRYKNIGDFQIPLPPLTTQKKIAAILDKAQALIDNDKKVLEKYDQLAQSVFLEMFGDPVRNEKGWERYKLNDLCNKITDGEHQNPEITQNGKYLIMGQDVKDDYIDFKRNIFVSTQDFEKFTKKCKPERDDILLISRGATIGRCTKIETDIPFALMGSVILIKPKEKEYSDYLNYLIKNPHFSRHVINLSSASAQQAIYLTHLKKMLVPFPPIRKQVEFSNKIQNIKLQKNNTQHSLQKSEVLFNSLLQKAFKGELVE